MKVAALSLAACLLAATAVAQPNAPAGPNPPPTPPSETRQVPPPSTATPPNTSATRSGTDDKDHNPSVAATSDANDQATPAKGSNSFTEGQAKSRIEDRGYANVSDLAKDDDGVWRGKAEHNGQKKEVWLDYKGNIGEQH